MLRPGLCALLLLSITACKSSSSGTSASTVPNSCSTDAECATGFICDHEMRRCVCTSDSACPTGNFCNAYTGQCVTKVAGCPSTVTCAANEYCDSAVRTCKAITPVCGACTNDTQCGPNSACVVHPSFPQAGSFCQASCSGSCSSGYSCLPAASGKDYCFLNTGACGETNTCVPDSLALCQNDADCGDPLQACDATLHACVAAQHSCPAGDACDPQSHLCVHVCGNDSDCAVIEGKPGYQCRNNACFARALCQQDSDCSNGQICNQNADGSKSCTQGCVTGADCPLSQACNTAVANHPRCTQGCAQNTDCPLNAVCYGGACATTTPTCSTLSCQATSVCPVGANCVNNCCVEANLSTLCAEGGSCDNACGAGGTSSCCTNGSRGCVVSCNSSCFPLNIGPCNGLADCQNKGLPADTICNTNLHQCQVMSRLTPCSSAADCPQKGFKCVPYSSLACPNAGNVCFPSEQAAEMACALSHP